MWANPSLWIIFSSLDKFEGHPLLADISSQGGKDCYWYSAWRGVLVFISIPALTRSFLSDISMPVKCTVCMYGWFWLGKLACRSPFVADRLESCTVDTLAVFFTSGWLHKCKSQELLKLFQKFIWFCDAGTCQAYAKLMRIWSSWLERSTIQTARGTMKFILIFSFWWTCILNGNGMVRILRTWHQYERNVGAPWACGRAG